MKWAHLLVGTDRISCPISYFEDDVTDLKLGETYWLFWSPIEGETPTDCLRRQKKILRVTDEVVRKNNGTNPAGYYEGVLLAFEDSEEKLNLLIDSKRLRIPTTINRRQATKATGRKESQDPKEMSKASLKRLKKKASKSNSRTFNADTSAMADDNLLEPHSEAETVPFESDEDDDALKLKKRAASRNTDTSEEMNCSLERQKALTPSEIEGILNGSSEKNSVRTLRKRSIEKASINSESSVNFYQCKKKKEECVEEPNSSDEDTLMSEEDSNSDVPLSVHKDTLLKNKELKKARVRSAEKNKKLSSEMEDLKKKLREAEEQLRLERELSMKMEGQLLRDHLKKLSQPPSKEANPIHSDASKVLGDNTDNDFMTWADKIDSGELTGDMMFLQNEEMPGSASSEMSFRKDKSLKSSFTSTTITDSTKKSEEKGGSVKSTPTSTKTSPLDKIDKQKSGKTSSVKKVDGEGKGEEKTPTAYKIQPSGGSSSSANSAKSKRDKLLQVKKSKKVSVRKVVKRALFVPQDWEGQDWVLTPEQEQSLFASVKKGQANDSRFVKKSSDLLWDREELNNRSARGLSGPKENEARPECTPLKKSYIHYLLEKRVEREGVSPQVKAQRATYEKCEDFLSSKISTVRRDLRIASQQMDTPDDESGSTSSSDD
ncbi:BEN domain-containing protein 5 [Frankliniella fusca]|uniref:BEN domain-containing protein 5 n=1 Tax=Frankliniella fusca TaxID=407009 RepID=A0AAE1LHM5_9NEOP|nr:BEN domain-containing protein 5 [Frankliniella fusca]